MQVSQASEAAEALQHLIWKFNFRPDSTIHASWLGNMPDGKLIKQLIGQPGNEGALVRHLMERLGITGQVFFDFSKPLARIALWEGEALERLVLYTGAVFHFQLLRRVVAREDIQQVRQVLGDDLYSFMQHRAPVMMQKIPIGIELPAQLKLKQRIVLTGLFCFYEAFEGYPPTFWKRILFKLPRGWVVESKRYAKLRSGLSGGRDECGVLIQKVAIEIKMGVNRDGKILFN